MWSSSGLHPKVWLYCFTGLVWIWDDGGVSASVFFFIWFLGGGRGGGVSVMCAILGCAAEVCLLAAVLCGLLSDVNLMMATLGRNM